MKNGKRMKRIKTNGKIDEIEGLVAKLLVALGEDPAREGLLKTPGRVAESLRFLTQGCDDTLDRVLNDAIFEEAVDEKRNSLATTSWLLGRLRDDEKTRAEFLTLIHRGNR